MCVCCQGPPRRRALITCAYSQSGFLFSNGQGATPCGVAYHPACIRVGPPFRSRNDKRTRLTFPPGGDVWPFFIGELCTVRSVLDRELLHRTDVHLLGLERMRLIDLAHAWAAGTYSKYRTSLNGVRGFEERHPGVSVLQVSIPERPPNGPSIILSWVEEDYSLRPGRSRTADTELVTFGTVRGIRSAVGFHNGLARLLGGDAFIFDRNNRMWAFDGRYTDDALSTLFATGLGQRLGTKVTPAHALLARHVLWMDKHFNHRFNQAVSQDAQRTWALAGLANVTFWLGWLRSRECFDLRWCDVTLIKPADGPTVDLPPGLGLGLLRLSDETKTSRSQTADVVVAYRSHSGLSFGLWFERASTLSQASPSDHRPIFVDSRGSNWTSKYFRQTFLYPCLEEQRSEGDPHL